MSTYIEQEKSTPRDISFSIKGMILFLLFIILPLFDMVNGFLVVGDYLPEGGLASPSQLGRLSATMILFLVCIFKKLNTGWVFLLYYLIGIEIFYGLQHLQTYGVMYGIMSAYKIVYIVLTCIVLKFYLKNERDYRLLGKLLKWNLYLISGSLFFTLFSGLGNSTYGHGFGTKGFFASGNGIGVYMGVMTLIMFAFKKYKIYENVSTVALVIFALSTGVIGSKTAMLLSLICLFCLMWFSRYRSVWLVLGVVGFILILPKVYEVFNVVFDVVVKRYEASESLIMFLGSGRIGYVEGALHVFLAQSDVNLRLLFGSGAFVSYQVPEIAIYDTLETDLFDVLFMYGIVGVSFFLTFLVYIVFSLRKHFIFLLAAVLLFSHSIIAGHVIFNGMSSFAIVVLFIISNILKKRPSNAQ
ncbi:O-antigen ligase family protein [Shewanella sp. T24-MNA-CIBAN-0130]|uniref:O-antigen ligase family protein n=1 Tax=Shewanella sp. T24-MNA-CIBAN-0130 TaxID=3140470 RepID=UPI0033334391